jgi:hypothetical protein
MVEVLEAPHCERGDLSFNLEDEGDIILRNIGPYKNNATSPFPRKQQSPLLPLWKPHLTHSSCSRDTNLVHGTRGDLKPGMTAADNQ